MPDMRDKSDSFWREKLTSEQYDVLRNGATEIAGTGKLLHNHKSGMYTCAACGAELFSSNAKFESGTGWPSFDDPVAKEAIELKPDDSYGMHRVEVICRNCRSHLGHLFDDGPKDTTGKRYCINSCALDFKPQDQKAN